MTHNNIYIYMKTYDILEQVEPELFISTRNRSSPEEYRSNEKGKMQKGTIGKPARELHRRSS